MAAATTGPADTLPVLSLEYAGRIARDWNATDGFSGFVGFVTSFELQYEFSRRFPVQLAGGRSHEELCVPSAELDQFNAHIVGSITVLEAYPGPSFVGFIDPESNVPVELSDSYRSRPRGSDACTVRLATAQDAEASVAVLIASITTLCLDDHLNDPETLARWLRNKTIAQFAQWLADSENVIAIAEFGSAICGVGLLHSSGHVRLCYVLPDMQGRGVGRALIGRLEKEARFRGIAQLNLTSTGSARGFYQHLGFAPDGDARAAFGVLKEYPYKKLLESIAV